MSAEDIETEFYRLAKIEVSCLLLFVFVKGRPGLQS